MNISNSFLEIDNIKIIIILDPYEDSLRVLIHPNLPTDIFENIKKELDDPSSWFADEFCRITGSTKTEWINSEGLKVEFDGIDEDVGITFSGLSLAELFSGGYNIVENFFKEKFGFVRMSADNYILNNDLDTYATFGEFV